jgi:hypothetical protein
MTGLLTAVVAIVVVMVVVAIGLDRLAKHIAERSDDDRDL